MNFLFFGHCVPCSRWDHRQSCCWSSRSGSTWCPPARTPPAKRHEDAPDSDSLVRRGRRRRKDAETLYLLGLQRQLNEDLLQLLVHKVDAELFKSIFLERRQNSLYHRDLVETLSSPQRRYPANSMDSVWEGLLTCCYHVTVSDIQTQVLQHKHADGWGGADFAHNSHSAQRSERSDQNQNDTRALLFFSPILNQQVIRLGKDHSNPHTL